MTTPKLVEHFFRHEYGKIVAMLSCRVGVQHTEEVEDAVQDALMTGLQVWTQSDLPQNPSGWLYRVASNNLMGKLRQRTGRSRILDRYALDDNHSDQEPDIVFEGELQDNLLQMLFVCCDDAIPRKSQLVLALKVLCGFDVREISIRLFTSEANVYKRLTRARNRLRELKFCPQDLADNQYTARLPSVHTILYLLFTEGYLSSHTDTAIRKEVCEEAIRLTTILIQNSIGQTPESFALLALMHLHTARIAARQDASGGLLLLEEQDRDSWDQTKIQFGLNLLAKSAKGDEFSRYHAEAGIAAEHCLAPSFRETRWDKVAELYALLEEIAPSALHRLNRAVAVAEWKGPEAGLGLIENFEPPTWLANSFIWAVVSADLNHRCQRLKSANRYRQLAYKLAPSQAVKKLIQRRWGD